MLAAEQARKLREEQAAERAKLAADKRLTWNAKEKRKRDAGMQSRGKNYVEEEKRCVLTVSLLVCLGVVCVYGSGAGAHTQRQCRQNITSSTHTQQQQKNKNNNQAGARVRRRPGL